MIELIKVIALLCQVSSGNNFTIYEQLRCQREYVICTTQQSAKTGFVEPSAQALWKCIEENNK